MRASVSWDVRLGMFTTDFVEIFMMHHYSHYFCTKEPCRQSIHKCQISKHTPARDFNMLAEKRLAGESDE